MSARKHCPGCQCNRSPMYEIISDGSWMPPAYAYDHFRESTNSIREAKQWLRFFRQFDQRANMWRRTKIQYNSATYVEMKL